MNIQEQLDEIIQSSKGIKKILYKQLFKVLQPILKEAKDELEEICNKSKKIDEEQNLLKDRLKQIEQLQSGFNNRLEPAEINLRNNNMRIDKLESSLDMNKIKISKLEKAHMGKMHTAMTEAQKPTNNQDGVKDAYTGIDYFDFENYFRGSRNQIKENQKVYIPYYKGHSNVLDVGCGRGEFLELMRENNIEAYGVDMYEEFVELCTQNGLRVVLGDAIDTIRNAEEKLGGIFAGQLVEHLNIKQLVAMCEGAYEKLEEGACFIMETPNPTSLAIYTHAFYIDPSHQKPVHPLTLQYILEKSGFKHIEIIYTEESLLPVRIPAIQIDGSDNEKAFNDAMQEVQNTLFGSQDYAIVAIK